MQSYNIPSINVETLTQKLDRLNRRCKKLGIDPIEYTVENAVPARVFLENETQRKIVVPESDFAEFQDNPTYSYQGQKMPMNRITLNSHPVQYAGWEFIAVLEPYLCDNDDEKVSLNVIMTLPGKSCPNEYTEKVGICDHCNTKRKRNQTFVVQHVDGETKAVGRQCLKDFLGHDNPSALADIASILGGFDSLVQQSQDIDGYGGTGDECYDLHYYLSWVAGVIRGHGWKSRTSARETGQDATVDHVNFILRGRPGGSAARVWDQMKEECSPTEADESLAETALNWVSSISDTQKNENDYLNSIATVARIGYCDSRSCGLGGSIIAAYNNQLERDRRREKDMKSQHVGEIKKRREFDVKVERIMYVEGYYGVTYMHKFDAKNPETGEWGNKMVWFASSPSDMDEGKEYHIKATPKKHDEYRDIPQTTVNRVVVMK